MKINYRRVFNFTIGCVFFLFFFNSSISLYSRPFPISFSVSETKIVQEIPQKDRDFSFLIPGHLRTYIYQTESDYYQSYQRSYFAITCVKAGWDCLRHYEILANGCIPYFIDIDKCNPKTMPFLPRELIKEAMNLRGVSHLRINQEELSRQRILRENMDLNEGSYDDYLKIDHSIFDKEKYYEILNKLLIHAREYLTSKIMAKYILDSVRYRGSGKILYLSNDLYPDYLRCCTLIGFKELLQDRIVDVPKIPHIYKNYSDNPLHLYGRGFTYTRIVDDFPVDRENIEQRIKNREFDLVIYGSIHRGTPYLSLVRENYRKAEIIYLCGEDAHNCEHSKLHNLFLREYDAYKR